MRPLPGPAFGMSGVTPSASPVPTSAKGFTHDAPHRVLRLLAKLCRTRTVVMRNETPLVSFTFDDVPASAFRHGLPILERFGVKGTFYVAAGTCGSRDDHWDLMTYEEVRAMHRRGHEIGCHTYSHVNVQSLSARGLDEECRRNGEALRAICGDVIVANFAFPFGDVGIARKLQLQRHFISCRGTYQGVNSGRIDLGLLKVIELYDRTLSEEKLARVLDETVRRNGWLIFYTHDVRSSPSPYGCSPARLRAVVEATRRYGIEAVPVRDALERIGARPRKVPGVS
jgi:peptidoglycan/xylan/chitin deacetylase (PgdA/CDA1 family)